MIKLHLVIIVLSPHDAGADCVRTGVCVYVCVCCSDGEG